METNSDFIRFLGELLFAPETNRWTQFSLQQQEQYCQMAQKVHLEMLFSCYLNKTLPAPYRTSFHKAFLHESVQRLLEEENLRDLYRFFESEKIPFVPIKGADLAFRIYPSPALRPHEDWDILFREEDCRKVIQLLQKRGWQTFSGSDPKKPVIHHYERMHKGSYALEVHQLLPHFGNASAKEIWQETQKVTEYHRMLTPEMNLLLISAHASADFYNHVSPWKIMLDGAMILKHDPIDWEKVHQLADRWEILRPDLLLHVWNALYPQALLAPEDSSSKEQKLIRAIYETREVLHKHSSWEKRVAVDEPRNLQWLKARFTTFKTALICQRHHIPAKPRIRVFWYGLGDFLKKSLFFLAHCCFPNPELRSYCRKVTELEKRIKHQK